MLGPTRTEKVAPVPSKSDINAVAPTETSRKLQMALFDWREQNACLKFSPAHLQNMGSYIFLSNQIISAIVECARDDRIGTVALLYKETRWRKEWMDEFGESILSVVRSFYPPTLPTATAADSEALREPSAAENPVRP
ncbi:hypothetical protein BJ912DRAFT_175127 [Pholiota molesta]|nr:hypothetical protein BJ912DRAFT_175127 [Pholiota molesta]